MAIKVYRLLIFVWKKISIHLQADDIEHSLKLHSFLMYVWHASNKYWFLGKEDGHMTPSFLHLPAHLFFKKMDWN